MKEYYANISKNIILNSKTLDFIENLSDKEKKEAINFISYKVSVSNANNTKEDILQEIFLNLLEKHKRKKELFESRDVFFVVCDTLSKYRKKHHTIELTDNFGEKDEYINILHDSITKKLSGKEFLIFDNLIKGYTITEIMNKYNITYHKINSIITKIKNLVKEIA